VSTRLPVVDEVGVLVAVISLSDLARAACAPRPSTSPLELASQGSPRGGTPTAKRLMAEAAMACHPDANLIPDDPSQCGSIDEPCPNEHESFLAECLDASATSEPLDGDRGPLEFGSWNAAVLECACSWGRTLEPWTGDECAEQECPGGYAVLTEHGSCCADDAGAGGPLPESPEGGSPEPDPNPLPGGDPQFFRRHAGGNNPAPVVLGAAGANLCHRLARHRRSATARAPGAQPPVSQAPAPTLPSRRRARHTRPPARPRSPLGPTAVHRPSDRLPPP